MEVQPGRAGGLLVGLCGVSEASQVLVCCAKQAVGLRPICVPRARCPVLQDSDRLLRLSLQQPHVRQQEAALFGGVRAGVVLDHLGELARGKRRFWFSKANRAPWSSRLAISSARRLVDSCQTNSTAAMTMTAPIHELSCLCRLTQATKRSENPSPVPPTTGATEAAVAFVAVAISVLFYLG